MNAKKMITRKTSYAIQLTQEEEKQEVWLPVNDERHKYFYEVSNFGRVRTCWCRNAQSWKVLNQIVSGTSSYFMVCLFDCNSKYERLLVHRLVAEAFLENPDNLDTVNHINGNKLDNRVCNLEFMQFKDNVMLGALNRKNCVQYPVAKFDSEGNLVSLYYSLRDAERKNEGCNKTRIGNACNSNRLYKGFRWKKLPQDAYARGEKDIVIGFVSDKYKIAELCGIDAQKIKL